MSQAEVWNALTRKREAETVGAPTPQVGLGDLISDMFKTAEDTKKSALENWFGTDPEHQIAPETMTPEQLKQAAESLKQQTAPVVPLVTPIVQPVAEVIAPTVAPVVADSVVDEMWSRVKSNWKPLALIGIGVTGAIGAIARVGKMKR